jgi:hypothetical protein
MRAGTPADVPGQNMLASPKYAISQKRIPSPASSRVWLHRAGILSLKDSVVVEQIFYFMRIESTGGGC